MDYKKEFNDTLEKSYQNEKDGELLKMLIYYGVKMINADSKLFTTVKLNLTITEAIIDIIARITPREVMELFPINKTYTEMEAYVHKDAIYTIDRLENIGLNNLVGENVYDLLWGYMNDELAAFNSRYVLLLNALLKEQGKVPICTLLSYLHKIDVDTSGYSIFQ